MLIGQGREFWFLAAKGLAPIDGAEWSSSNPRVAEVLDKTRGIIVAKAEGTAKIRARLGDSTAEATVRVYPGNRLPVGTPIWELEMDKPIRSITPAIH